MTEMVFDMGRAYIIFKRGATLGKVPVSSMMIRLCPNRPPLKVSGATSRSNEGALPEVSELLERVPITRGKSMKRGWRLVP
jgi:hypothetical protein